MAQALKLNVEQRNTLLLGLQYRMSRFPRGSLINRLIAADQAYHLARIQTKEQEEAAAKNNSNFKENEQDYSRFQGLDNALVREVAETYGSKYVTTFLGKQQIFAMTGGPDVEPEVEAFNTIMQDQQKQWSWRSNLVKVMIDAAKYNLCGAEVNWEAKKTYTLQFDPKSTGGSNLTKALTNWSGNQIRHLNLYNTIFDLSVAPDEVAEKGEIAGDWNQYTQVQLKTLIDILSDDPGTTVYLTKPDEPNFSVYTVGFQTQFPTQSNAGSFSYINPDVIPNGDASSIVPKDIIDWASHFGGLVDKDVPNPNNCYTVAKLYLRVVPSSYGVGNTPIEKSDVEIWQIHVLNSMWILATKRMDNAHGLLPIVFGQTDVDSLDINTSGPTQVTIPYQRTAKEIMDRVLAGADRAIGDRAIYDSNYLDKTVVSSHIPDPKMPLKKTLINGRTIDSIYKQVPFNGDAIFRLIANIDDITTAGRKAAGLNPAQQGQFVPGNRTLQEYTDTQSNAQDKPLIRALHLETTIIMKMKQIIKLNIVQYQQSAKLYNPETQSLVSIDPSKLYSARVDFAIADALMPTQFMMSPNVQQQLFQLIGTAPQLFQQMNVDIGKMIMYIVTQSLGVPLSKFQVQQQQSGQPTVAQNTPGAQPGQVAGQQTTG